MPIQALNEKNIPKDRWSYYTLPSSLSTPQNFLMISIKDVTLYVVYRRKEGYDFELDETRDFGNRVLVYSNAGSFTNFETGIHQDQKFTETRLGTNIVIIVLRLQSNQASIKLCHPSQPIVEGNCIDGLDNDCDGYIDTEDTDCIAEL
jgi:hypothetical protein